MKETEQPLAMGISGVGTRKQAPSRLNELIEILIERMYTQLKLANAGCVCYVCSKNIFACVLNSLMGWFCMRRKFCNEKIS